MTNTVFSVSGGTTSTAALTAPQADKEGSLAAWWTLVGAGFADAAAALAGGWVLIDLRGRAGDGMSVGGRKRRLKLKLAGGAAQGAAISAQVVALQSLGGTLDMQTWHQQQLVTLAGSIGTQTGVAGKPILNTDKYAVGLTVTGVDGTAAYGGVRIVGANLDEAHIDLLDDAVIAVQVSGAAGNKVVAWAEVGC